MNSYVWLIAVAALLGVAAVSFAPSKRRAVAYGVAVLLVVVVGTVPAVATFSANPSGHTHPTPSLPFNSTSMPTISLTSPACTYTGTGALHVDWTALSSTYSWVGAVQPQKQTNGGGYSDFGSALAYNSSTVSDSGLTPASNTYTYRVQARQGQNWTTTSAATASSATCADKITTESASNNVIPGSAGAELHAADGVYADASGNVYIADTGGNRIEFVPATAGTYYGISMAAGFFYILGGTSTGGSGGDGGLITDSSVRFNSSEAITADAAGNIYIADTGSNKIRVISNQANHNFFGTTIDTGKLNTIVGTGVSGTSADATDKLSAKLAGPKGVVLDSSGNLIISDTGNSLIRMVPAANGTYYGVSMTAGKIYTIAGSTAGFSNATPATSGQLSSQQQIAIDSSNNIYIADTGNVRIRKEAASNNALTTIAGTGSSGSTGDTGSALSATFSTTMSGVAVDGSGNVYVADGSNNKVRAISPSGCTCFGVTIAANNIDRVAGTGTSGYSGPGYPATQSKLSGPSGVAYANGKLYVMDTNNDMARAVTSHANLMAVAGNGTGGAVDNVAAAGNDLVSPEGAAVDSSGNVIFADKGGNRIRKWWADTGEISTLAGTGVAGSTGDAGSAAVAKVSAPEGVAVDTGDNVWIADTGSNKVRFICMKASGSCTVLAATISAGNIDTVAGGSTTAGTCADGTSAVAIGCKLSGPLSVAVDASGNLFIADTSNTQIRWVPNANANTPLSYGGGSETKWLMYTVATGLTTPRTVAVDGSGNVFFADANRIKEVPPAGGAPTTVAGNGTGTHCSSGSAATGACVGAATGLAIDGSTIYFVNLSEYVEKFTVGGNVTTIAGSASTGLSGDGGGAIGAAINAYGIAKKASGNVWVTGGTTTTIQLRQILGPI